LALSYSTLKNTVFQKTILKHADFSSAENFAIDPEANKVDKAKFSITGLRGLLARHNIIVK